MLVMRDVMVAKGVVEPTTRMAGIAKIQAILDTAEVREVVVGDTVELV